MASCRCERRPENGMSCHSVGAPTVRNWKRAETLDKTPLAHPVPPPSFSGSFAILSQ